MGSTRFLGLDISAKSTGVTILDRDDLTGRLSLVYVTHIDIPASVGYGANKTSFTDGQRLAILNDSLYEILDRFNPQVFIKEGLGANMNKFRSVSLVSKATGVVERVCQSWWGKEPLEIHAYPPMTIKKEVTGSGKADKEEVMKAIFTLFGTEHYSFVLSKRKGDTEKRPYFNDDETDSTAAIITHFRKNNIKFKTS